MQLTKEHLEILKHTAKNGLYCGDSKEMQDLCNCKMMEYAGKKSFVPDPYFRLGPDGKSAVEDMTELGMLRDRPQAGEEKR